MRDMHPKHVALALNAIKDRSWPLFSPSNPSGPGGIYDQVGPGSRVQSLDSEIRDKVGLDFWDVTLHDEPCSVAFLFLLCFSIGTSSLASKRHGCANATGFRLFDVLART